MNVNAQPVGNDAGRDEYAAFLATKRAAFVPTGIDVVPELSSQLFGFQRDITAWALRRGRAAVFADCGLGKGWIALEWSRVVASVTGRPVLILAPLAVSRQFVTEGERLGVEVNVCASHGDVKPGVNVANYERLHKFSTEAFGGVVLDESSILKDYTSATRTAVIDGFAATPFKLACTATPSPNDHIELGNHAEFLGAMTRVEMLAMFFTHDGGETQKWRLKGHAIGDFWEWVASWAVSLRKPSDLGYPDGDFELPPLNIHEHVVDTEHNPAVTGMLFRTDAKTLNEQRAARRESIADRVAVAAAQVAAEPDEQWLLWCDLNDESALLAKAIPGAVEVRGSDSTEHKESAMLGFASGEVKILVSKPSICGWGMNFQRCARTAFVGVSHSFEAWYQAIRRTWRFGQTRAVDCHVITSVAEGAVVRNLRRKQDAANELARGMVEHTKRITSAHIRGAETVSYDYGADTEMAVPAWLEG